MRIGLTALLAGALATALGVAQAPKNETDLEKPVKILAGKLPLDVQRSGHAAPFVGDFDGDGLPDLLVGQYTDGKLRIYRNVGTPKRPRFDGYEWFKAGGDFGRVPVG
jgi:hypothetical protein